MNSARNNRDLGDSLLGAVAGPSLPAHFYFHVPFCRSKCAYCDFSSEQGSSAEVVHAVFEGMRAQTEQWAAASLPGLVETVYVGGGTPSLHYGHTASLLKSVLTGLPVSDDAEVTVEANPDSLSAEALRALKRAGATRISLGVQSFDDTALGSLGRCHDSEQARLACAEVVDSGLRLSIDLMCGIPGRPEARRKAWVNSLMEAVGTGATHVSIYPLQLEDDTPLASAADQGLLDLPSEDEVADALEATAEFLSEQGLGRYEVANYAVPGHESRHNTSYWTGCQYAGIGPSAHGMLDAATAQTIGVVPPHPAANLSRVRYHEADSVESWLWDPSQELELLDHREAAREDAMLGLRMAAGIDDALAVAAGALPALFEMEGEGLVCRVSGRWRTTERGWLLGNEVFARVWCDDD